MRIADQPLEQWWPAQARRERAWLWVARVISVLFLALVLVFAASSQSEQEPSDVSTNTIAPAVEYAP